jgi:hypothetical protein
MPRVIGGSQGGERFLMGEVPVYRRTLGRCVSSFASNPCTREYGHAPPEGPVACLFNQRNRDSYYRGTSPPRTLPQENAPPRTLPQAYA